MKLLPDPLGQIAINDKTARDSQMESIAPQAIGTFSPNAMNKLVVAWNKASKLFGIAETYPTFSEPQKAFPIEFTKLLVMTSKAIEDAVAAQAVSEDLLLDLPNTKKDQDVVLLAAKVEQIAKSPGFKAFLLETPEPTEEVLEEEPKPESTPVGDDELMNLLASRVSK
tara:strand:+ start:5181 stop:5684 length:504 start_codon:yes stop_codon:yes gene_type:complete